mmetsp:Transcript_8922/g.22849  ORF Transcript_8922/g.22849 Transcript_8922/m.22849 type:complete len:210 (-) Transcript_8922:76-705(-)
MVGRRRGDDPKCIIVDAPENWCVKVPFTAQVRVDADDGPQFGKVVSALVVLAQQNVQSLRDGPSDGRQSEFAKGHDGREHGGDAQLLAASEDGRGDDLTEDEHQGDRHSNGQPRWDELVQEEGQSFGGNRVHQQECHQQPVVVLDERKHPLGSSLILLEFEFVLLCDHVLVLGVHDDFHLHRLDGYEAHGEARSQGRERDAAEGARGML